MDSFKVLGLDSGASLEDIKKSYRRLAKIYHPDTNIKDTSKQFLELKEAYDQAITLKKLELKYQLSPEEKERVKNEKKIEEEQPFFVYTNVNKTEITFSSYHYFSNEMCLTFFLLGAAIAGTSYFLIQNDTVSLIGIATSFVACLMKVYSAIWRKRNVTTV